MSAGDTPPSLLLLELARETAAFRGDYDVAKRFSHEWDLRLGFRKEEVESRLSPSPAGEQGWAGLPLPSLETPYPEIFEALEALRERGIRPDFRLVDLGAAYGRVALLQRALFGGSFFQGFELLPERSTEANDRFRALGIERARIETRNLAEVGELPEAEVYFIYDLGTVERIRDMLRKIQARARNHGVAVVGRGRATRNLIETDHPWLSHVIPPRHFVNLSVYWSA